MTTHLKYVISKYLLLFALIFLLFVLKQTLPLHAFAISPSFVRQEVKDRASDFLSYDPYSNGYRSADSNCTDRFYPPTDIKSVSYTSNGKTLNATIWLNSPPGISARDYHSPKNMTANELTSIKDITYSMYIDVNSVYESGVDYIINVNRNSTSNIWAQELIESSSPNAKYIKSERNSFGIGKGYVTISFDLATINYPEQYKLFFATRSELVRSDRPNYPCSLVDVTNIVIAPEIL